MSVYKARGGTSSVQTCQQLPKITSHIGKGRGISSSLQNTDEGSETRREASWLLGCAESRLSPGGFSERTRNTHFSAL